MRRMAAAALVLVGFLAFHSIALAQALGSIAGVVKDKSGSVLPGVTVRVASAELIESVRTTVTDRGGRYRVVNLPAGVYGVTFSLPGFSPMSREGVEVTAGRTAAVDAAMQGGAFNETFTLPGQRPRIGIPSAAQIMRPYTVCGLTIVPADPRVDPEIRVPGDGASGGPSKWRRTEHSMRTIAPRLCAEK